MGQLPDVPSGFDSPYYYVIEYLATSEQAFVSERFIQASAPVTGMYC